MDFRRVLVPVDLGERNGPAVALAAALAGAEPEGKLILLHVIEPIEDAPEEEVRDFYAGLEARARTTMEQLTTELPTKPSTIEHEIVYGRRLPEILAASADVDLVVVRSHRVEPGRPGGGFGTLSHEVVLLAEVPVLVLK